MEDNNKLDQLVKAIVDEKPVDAEELFKAEIGDRLKVAIDAKKTEIGKTLFAKKPDPPSQLDDIINPEE